MNVFGTQMHIVTFIFIVLEMLMLAVQTGRYFYRLEDKHRGRYTLLLLLIIYDINRGLFPDPQFFLSIRLQHIIPMEQDFLPRLISLFIFTKNLI